jgi:hypothetical protein
LDDLVTVGATLAVEAVTTSVLRVPVCTCGTQSTADGPAWYVAKDTNRAATLSAMTTPPASAGSTIKVSA